ncbi:NADP-dependent oxidoreductase [Umezawaea endophytica]|uniref:NADP-dependent oxidoreductase n=1 Tax=Umezawaea endophytica TaxID=1654476 RepID=A0A9X2VQI0_9PSEU|nr:NADP-dependent oxidoreductase [Umezawaea endophytica]MCS7480474.1 NADP-dependent oxidoreductase [Umezawaea endophytica]
MRIITQQEFGGPDVLTVVDAPTPRPMPTEVLVRVEAIGLNPVEARLRSGEFPLLGEPPFTLGWDISGVVDEAPGTWRFRPGDEVFGMPLFPKPANGYAELVLAPALHLARKPASLSHVEAAALPVVGLTAWQGLVDLAGVTAGDRVLVHGGGGGVGHVAIQIAKALGAHVITTASDREFVEGFGADEVIDYTAVDFTEVVRDVDVVLDTIGGDTVERSIGVLRPGGHLVTAVAEEDLDLIARCEAAGLRFSGIAVDPDPVALRRLVDLVEQGRLRVHVQETFPFERVADAHRVLDGGHLRGKVVLTV